MTIIKYVMLMLVATCAAQDSGVITGSSIPPTVHQVLILEPIPIANLHGQEELRLECSASGNPAPIIRWSFNGILFKKGVPFGQSGGEGDKTKIIRHTITGNRLVLKKVKGETYGKDKNKYDTGRYRCIAENPVGSVFLEKNIKIRVMGIFLSGSKAKDEAKKWNPTVGRQYKIACPPHTIGYGTEYRWGNVPKQTNQPEYWLPGQRNPKIFYTLKGEIVWTFIAQDDIKESRDMGGLQCILINFGQFQASNRQVLWHSYNTVLESRKPDLVARLAGTMMAPLNTEFRLVCGATGKPAPKYRWQYQGVDIVSRYNKSDELNFEFFQFLGHKMELRIRRITKYSGGTFRCIAENDRGIVWSIGQLSVSFPPHWMKKFPESIDVAVGNPFTLICNATGFPQPKFEWFQNSSKIDNTVTSKRGKVVSGDKKGDIGGKLVLASSDYMDNGIYICVAWNYLDTLTMSVNIKIQAMAPQFKIPLDDPIYLFKTETMYIKCDPAGGPIPEKKWKKDNKILETGGRYVIHKNGTLEIRHVQKSDVGRYTCEATNYLGKAESHGTATILEPTIIKDPPKSLSHSINWGYTVMYCGATWDPRLDLRIEWYKGGVRMAKFSDRIFLETRAKGPPRLLYIKELTIYDAGNYSCHAYTRVGNIVSEQRKMAVLRIKGAPQPPAGVSVSGDCGDFNALLTWSRGEELNEETRYFFIEYSTNHSSQADAWYGGKGDPLAKGSGIRAEPGTLVKFELTEKHLVPGANLIFRIKAASQFLVGKPSRPSKINTCITPARQPVRNPLNVTGVTKGPGTLTIQWRMIRDVYHGASGFYYEVSYKLAEASQFTISKMKDGNVTSFDIPSPGIYKKYNFKVRAWNSLGKCKVEPTVVTKYSGREKPVQEVRNLKVIRLSRFSVDLSWTPLKDVSGFRITYWNITDAEMYRGRSKRAATDPIVKKYQYFMGPTFSNGGSMTNLTAQVTFLATIAAVNNGGIGPESRQIQFHTEARVPGAPSNVKLVVYGQSIHLSWHPPINPNGYIEQYVISWYKSDQGAEIRNVEPPKKISKDRRAREAYLIDQFTPFTYYDIKLMARNRVGPGADWQRERVTVSAADIPGKSTNPKAVPFDDSKINITYQRPSYGGLPTHFFVYYRPTGHYFEQPLNRSIKFPYRAWILITDLKFLVYDFWTVGINELGQSETSDVTEMQPIRRPKGAQAHASPFEWWRSNWFIAISMCVLFVLITMTVVIILLRPGPIPYARIKDNNVNGGFGASKVVVPDTQPLQPLPVKSDDRPKEPDFGDQRYLSTSEEPQSEQDNPPPRYSSRESSLEKKEASGSESASRSGSGSDYSDSETGSGSEYSEEDASEYSDEEKKRSDSEEDDDDEQNELAAFV